jgi:hypothetical protein
MVVSPGPLWPARFVVQRKYQSGPVTGKCKYSRGATKTKISKKIGYREIRFLFLPVFINVGGWWYRSGKSTGHER